MSTYFSNPAISQSKLKDLKQSPKHFWANHINPNLAPRIETEAMKFGKAVHSCLFENQYFQDTYKTAPNIDKRTKSGKVLHEEFLVNNANKIIISYDDMAAVKLIYDSILNKKTSKIILSNGLAEHELYWVDKDTNIECKAKLDYLIEPCAQFPNGLIIDLKTTTNAEPNEFAKSIYNFGYYNQQAFYCDAVKAIYKTDDYPPFIFIPVEKTAPFECSFLAGDETMLNIGLQENLKLLNLYKKCLESDNWFGYEDKVQTIGLPNWAINKFNFEESSINE